MIGSDMSRILVYPSQNTEPFQIYYSRWRKKNPRPTRRKYLDIHGDFFHPSRWRGNDDDRRELEEYLAEQDPEGHYYAVISDNKRHIRWPRNTMFFQESGACSAEDCESGIIIPFFVNPRREPDLHRVRSTLVNFIGNSETHPCRSEMIRQFQNFGNAVIHDGIHIHHEGYYNIMEQSVFTLCPRGHEISSFRLYEALHFGSIPVYVSDIHALPFQGFLNWEDFALILKMEDIGNLQSILLSLSSQKIKDMQEAGRYAVKNVINEEFTCKFISEVADFPIGAIP